MAILKHTPPFSYFELIDLCAQPGCPLCRLADKTTDRAISMLFDDGGVVDVDVRAELRASLGHCPQHARYLIDRQRKGSRSPLGMAIVYADILKEVGRKLDATTYTPNKNLSLDKQVESQLNTWFNRPKKQPNADAAVRSLQPEGPCPICVRRDETIALAIDTLTTKLGENETKLIAALEASDGLCLPHLRQSIAFAKLPVVLDQLKRITAEHMQQLAADLEEFKRKQDHRYLDEKLTDGERDAWQRVVRFMVGTGL